METRFTKEQIEQLAKYEDMMKQLINTQACSYIPIEYRELMIQLNKHLGLPIACTTCNAELIRYTTNVWNVYQQDKNIIQQNVNRHKGHTKRA